MPDDINLEPYLEAKSDRIIGDDLMAGPRTFRIVRVEELSGTGDDKAIAIHLEGNDGKPFRPCKGMLRLLVALWGKYTSEWIGRDIVLFRDPDVRFGAEETGGVRIAAMSHIDARKTVPVRVSRGRAKKYNVDPIKSASAAKNQDAPPADEWTDDAAPPATAHTMQAIDIATANASDRASWGKAWKLFQAAEGDLDAATRQRLGEALEAKKAELQEMAKATT